MHSYLQFFDGFGIPGPAAKAIAILSLFAAASVVARLAGLVARRIESGGDADDAPSPLVALSRRETAVSLAQTTIRYIAFLVAVAFSIVVVTNGRSIGAVAGASFIAVLVGFAAQRFLMDVIAGIVMFFEGWYTVGSTIVVEPLKLEGVVEDISLRATKIRDVSGEVLRVHNSQILAVRVLPDGGRHVQIELFVRDPEAAQQLLEHVAKLLPTGPTAFVEPPRVTTVTELDQDLHRLTAEATVAAGRNWMAESLLPSLLRERADDDLIVHGPVILPIDEHAASRFERARRFRTRRPRRMTG